MRHACGIELDLAVGLHDVAHGLFLHHIHHHASLLRSRPRQIAPAARGAYCGCCSSDDPSPPARPRCRRPATAARRAPGPVPDDRLRTLPPHACGRSRTKATWEAVRRDTRRSLPRARDARRTNHRWRPTSYRTRPKATVASSRSRAPTTALRQAARIPGCSAGCPSRVPAVGGRDGAIVRGSMRGAGLSERVGEAMDIGMLLKNALPPGGAQFGT